MEKAILRQIVVDQKKSDVMPDKLVPRHAFEAIIPYLKTPQVILFSGVRRGGKSTWMHVIRTQMPESAYYMNFDDEWLSLFHWSDFKTLVEIFIEQFGLQTTFYFDEIQNIDGWERFVRRLHNEKNKVFVTGSNANLFSAELGTHLTGRNIALELFPFSFKEYVQRVNLSLLNEKTLSSTEIAVLKKYFSEFKQLGGFPEYLNNPNKAYLQSVYENILYKDIIVRHKINNVSAIRDLGYYLASNIAKPFSYNALRKLLGISNASTAADYCRFFEENYLSFIVHRFSFSVKQQVQSVKKNYFIDQAMAKVVGFRFSEDRGRMLENIIFLQLKRKFHHIYYHQEKNECDFLIREGHHVTQAIQVCDSLYHPDTMNREIAGLVEAMEIHQLSQGIIITEDEELERIVTHQNKTYHIVIIPAWRWLLI